MNPEAAAMFQKHSYSVSCRITRVLRRNHYVEEITAVVATVTKDIHDQIPGRQPSYVSCSLP